jgi:hypothetical protein
MQHPISSERKDHAHNECKSLIELIKDPEPHWTWSSVLLPNQVHLVLLLVIDLQDCRLLNWPFNEFSRSDFLRVGKKLVLELITDVFLDQDVITVFLD